MNSAASLPIAIGQSALEPSTSRVLHVIASISPRRGGPSTAIWNTLRSLQQRGFAVDLVTTDDDGPDSRLKVPLGEFIEYQGFRVCFFSRQTSFYAASWPMLRWLVSQVRHYDLVHTHALFTFAPLAAASVARAYGVPYILRPAGMIERWSRSNRRRILKRLSIALLEGPLLRAAAAVHLTSRSELDQAADLKPGNATLIPLGLPASDDPREDRGVPEALLDLKQRRTILFLSRIDPKKGLEGLLHALALLVREQPTATLVIAGDGGTAYVATLKRLCEQLGIIAHVHWIGFVQGELKQALLRHSEFFLLPSWSENFGVAVVEAMAAGLPVIVTSAVGVSDLVRDYSAGIVADNTPDALHDAMTELLSSHQLRQKMGAAGVKAVAENLTLDVYGQRLDALYRSLLSRSGPPSA